MVDFFSSRKKDSTICIRFWLDARKVLQRKENICYSRPELLNNKGLAHTFLQLYRIIYVNLED